MGATAVEVAGAADTEVAGAGATVGEVEGAGEADEDDPLFL